MKTKAPIILASNSPRRQQLLTQAGIEHTVLVRPVDENVSVQIHPRAVAVLISEQKAKAYGDLSHENIVITADTIVAKKGDILGKPKDEAEAISMLESLSGEKHEVVTGVSIFHKGRFKSFAEETVVYFRDCLLYTSPSPRDKRQSRMPSSA